jgi:hypothetical protein
MRKSSKYKQGYYEPVYKDKWVITENSLDPGKIKYRSSWERHFCVFADMSPDIIMINSEGIIVPYISPLDNKEHRYFIDFIIKNKQGKIYLVEIKPRAQTILPKSPKNNSEKEISRYKKAIETYVVNKAKWEAAEIYAASKGFQFIIITGNELGL